MKYIITDKGEARTSIVGYHADMADECDGKVVRAGHCRKKVDGNYEVWGSSIGFGINSDPEDAELLKKFLME